MKYIDHQLRKFDLTFGEVEGEGGLIDPQIVDGKDKIFWEVVLCSPDNPSDSGIDESILVPAHVYALHQWKLKIPFQIRIEERCNKSATCRVHMYGCVPPATIGRSQRS